MASKPTLISKGRDLGFTIVPYTLDTPIQDEVNAQDKGDVIGYVVHNSETEGRRFIYTEVGISVEAPDHWSLSILNEFPYCEKNCDWIVYRGDPEAAACAFSSTLSKYAQTLHVYNWDIWSIGLKKGNVAVVTSWERY